MPPKIFLAFVLLSASIFSAAQKKPLDHSVYDSWQNIGEKMISNDGKWVVYTIDPQEGDNELVIQSSDSKYKKTIPRGYRALITEDNRFVVLKIKPFYKDTREARIKKKKVDDFPKDSLAIVELGKDSIWKTAKVKDYKTPEKSYGWIAYHLEKKNDPLVKPARGDSKKVTDSLQRVVDSLQGIIESMTKQASTKNKRSKDEADENFSDADDDDAGSTPAEVVSDLVLKNLSSGQEKIFTNVSAYYFSKNGCKLLVKQNTSKDSLSKTIVLLYDLRKGFGDTLSRGGNAFKNFAMTDDGIQVAYVADRDSARTIKGQPRIYRLWYYKEGMDSAAMFVDKNTVGMQIGMTVSEFGNLEFSKSGKRLFFGTSEMQLPEDTITAEIDKVKLDIWHYNDEYLQTVQLYNLKNNLQRNYLAVYDFATNTVKQLGSEKIPTIYKTNEGDGEIFVGVSDFDKRIESQWTGTTKKDIYAINVNEGSVKLIKNDLVGVINPSYTSSTGKYIMWYDSKAKNYFVWDGDAITNITEKIKVPLWDEDHDSPSDPFPYGVMGWYERDSAVFIYDKYDVWIIDLITKSGPSIASPINGRKVKWIQRYIKTNSEEKFIRFNSSFLFNVFNEKDKTELLWFDEGNLSEGSSQQAEFKKVNYSSILKAKNANAFIYTSESFSSSPDIYFNKEFKEEIKLSSINSQQNSYNWITAELFKWKAYDGKESEGIVYKPENFDPKKKYPMICYFYETLSDGLYNYLPPAPTPSRLSIPFFVSRGYIVFAPDIHYGTGHPGRDAYNYVVSGTRALIKKGFIDSTRLGLQGQSWGGYQVAYIITMTNLYKAAWAGAPVANMTSAYGGIRWESGLNRQFQYEKTQSRIGATLWEKPELYIENSPLFRLPKVKTPLVIMSNDKDGAVPWYQGIELFTAMRRLNKQAWLLNYNGEAHNLVERRNRKDISIREQQFFDWLLKGERPAKWISEGVPAVKKGKDWGFELVD